MKTLKDKIRENPHWSREQIEDLKQAIKDLKEELKNKQVNKRRTNNQIIDKIMGVWEE